MNTNSQLAIIVLAAGLGKRMRSGKPKVITPTREMPLIHHILTAIAPLNAVRTVVVVGHKRELVEDVVRKGVEEGYYRADGIEFAHQETQLGTGDAVRSALPLLADFNGEILILCGDTPLLRTESLQAFVEAHYEALATLTVGTFTAAPGNSYGRIVRDAKSYVTGIVETKDCTPEQLKITEANAGLYVVDSAFLIPAVKELTNNNAQGEYYLTDIVARAHNEGQRISGWNFPDAREALGVNSPKELVEINRVLMERNHNRLLDAGVILEDPNSTYVDTSVEVGPGTVIGPNVQLKGRTKVGSFVRFEGSALLIDTIVEDEATIKLAVRAESTHIGPQCSVGPFAHLRPKSRLGKGSKVGNFVETKAATLGEHVAASHLTYLGDCEVGSDTNIGAGTITCNYDGANKHRTIIGERVFIGSNTALVAPVCVGNDATIGAGSVIQKDVPASSLAVTRPPLTLKERYERRKK